MSTFDNHYFNVNFLSFSKRSGLTFVCGIYVFGATWFLLGTNPEESVNEAVAPQFMVSTHIYNFAIVIGENQYFPHIFIGANNGKM